MKQSQMASRQQREAAALRVVLQSAPAVLQDMAAQSAEAVAVCYLAEARSGLNGKLCHVRLDAWLWFITLVAAAGVGVQPQ